MGFLPLERELNMEASESCSQEHNKVAAEFNSKLQTVASNLARGELTDVKFTFGNLYDFSMDVVKYPKSYGFENAVSGCCATGMFEMGYKCNCNRRSPFTCSDADEYIFWDAFHPTERMNQLIANHLINTALYM